MTSSPAQQHLPAVLVLHPSDELYGADRVLLSVLDAIATIVHVVVVLPTDVPAGHLSTELRGRGFEVARAPLPVMRRRYKSPGGVLRLAFRMMIGLVAVVRLARRHGVRAIHTNTIAILVGPVAARALGIAHIWHVHEIIESPGWLAGVVAALARRSGTHVVAISEAVQGWLERAGGRVTVVLRDPAPEWEQLPMPRGARIVTIIGRVNGSKGHAEFVDAAEQLHPRYPDVCFRVVGGPVPGREGPYQAILVRIARLDPEGAWLQFTGWSDDVRGEIARSTIVALPSTLPEGLNITALEAMAIGRPVVATATGGLPEVVLHGQTGLLVPPGDAIALADSIAQLLDDPELGKRLAVTARGRVEHDFAASRYRTAWYQLYRDLLALPDPDRPAG